VDFNKCDVSLERTNSRKRHGMAGLQIREPGHYTRDTKLTILFAMELANPELPTNQNDRLVERPEALGLGPASRRNRCGPFCGFL
jgi:hypothetical protein